MFKSFLGSWRFKEIKADLTEVTFLYSFQLRFPFSLFNGMIKRNLNSNVKQRLMDLKLKVESNEINNKNRI